MIYKRVIIFRRLKGKNELKHMRIKYHFLPNFHVKSAPETKAYAEYCKQTL